VTGLRHLSWENFRATVLVSGQQRVHRVAAVPLIELFSDGNLNRIGILLETPADTVVPAELSRLTFITARTINRGTQLLLEISTSATSLQRQFYHFAVAVAERVIVEHLQPVAAVALELECFADLLTQTSLLGIEQQIGLLGELHFLQHLVTQLGARQALEAWLSPLPEPHDFRIQSREFEVKTTVAARRIHTIHGVEQLVPCSGCALFLVSVMLGPPGAAAGFSLADKVAVLSGLFAPLPALLGRFTAAVEARGFRPADAVQYTRRFVARRPMGLVAVDTAFPVISRPVIQQALGAQATRVESLQYDVNVDGLELEEGAAQFAATVLGQ
jgi:Putative  PD-(D/E)XK family member, (DUF4420)